jgi:hypothetical protein
MSPDPSFQRTSTGWPHPGVVYPPSGGQPAQTFGDQVMKHDDAVALIYAPALKEGRVLYERPRAA